MFNRDKFFSFSSHFASQQAFGLMSRNQTGNPEDFLAGVAVLAVATSKALDVDLSEVINAALRWDRDSQHHDRQENRGHHRAIREFLKQEMEGRW